MPSCELWLVRTTMGEILGPFSQTLLCEKLKAGCFVGEDEVCRSGDYWFRLYERPEVESKLGADVPVLYPRSVGHEDELTQTETETTAVLQSDPVHDFVPQKTEAPLKDSPFSLGHLSSLSLGKILLGVFLIMVLIRLLLTILRPE